MDEFRKIRSLKAEREMEELNEERLILKKLFVMKKRKLTFNYFDSQGRSHF